MIAQKNATWHDGKTECSEQEEVRSKQSEDGHGKHRMSKDAKGRRSEEEWFEKHKPKEPTHVPKYATYARRTVNGEVLKEAIAAATGNCYMEVDRFGELVTLVDKERGEVLECFPEYSWLDRPQVNKPIAKKTPRKRIDRKPRVLEARGTPSMSQVFKK